jgi:hypothetical protein
MEDSQLLHQVYLLGSVCASEVKPIDLTAYLANHGTSNGQGNFRSASQLSSSWGDCLAHLPTYVTVMAQRVQDPVKGKDFKA